MIQILKDMGITEYEPRVINQMLEFTYSKYTFNSPLFVMLCVQYYILAAIRQTLTYQNNSAEGLVLFVVVSVDFRVNFFTH